MNTHCNWPTVRLGDHADLLTGFPFKSQEFTSALDDIPLVKGENVQQGYVDWSIAKRWPRGDLRKHDKFRLRQGDVVLAMDRPWVDAGLKFAWIRRRDPECLLVQRVARVRGANGLETDYLRYVIASPAFTDYIRPVVTGVNVPHISPDQIRSFRFLLPPLPVQHEIASILSAYDDLIENNQRRIRILEEMARNLYREWFVKFRFPGHETATFVDSPLGKIPKGWEVKPVGGITAYLNRGISPTYDESGDSVVVNQKCIRDCRLNLAPARRQTRTIPSDKRVRFGDVLINSTGVGTLGRAAQVCEDLPDTTVDTHVTIARPSPDVDVDFFGCALLALQETFDRLGVGATGQTELSRTSIASIELVCPLATVQHRFGDVVHAMRSAATTLQRQTENLRRTRDLLLPKLVSGKVVIACKTT